MVKLVGMWGSVANALAPRCQKDKFESTLEHGDELSTLP